MRTLFRRASAWGLHHGRFLHSGAAGFAGIRGLNTPQDWFMLAHEASTRCEELVKQAVESPPSAETVQTLDDISDTLCQVLDAAEFCRSAHSDPEWRSAAQQVCIDLGGYVQELNTHYGLYTAIDHALQRHTRAAAAAAAAAGGGSSSSSSTDSSSSSSSSPGGGGATSMGSGGWSQETVLVARMLKRDFEKFGVHLSGRDRDRMTQLVGATQQLGMHITHNIVSPEACGAVELLGEAAGATRNLPQAVQRAFRPLSDRRSGRVLGVTAPADASLLNTLLKFCPEEAARKQAYLALYQQPAGNMALMDQLAEARHEIARLMGYESYAHYQLDGVTLANRPEAVQAFLQDLSAAIRPKCSQEMGRLQEMARAQLAAGAGSGRVQPWDKNYLIGAAKAQEPNPRVDLSQLPHYLQLEPVMSGLSKLLRKLMGVTLEERPLAKGEGWAPGVRKLEAIHESEGLLGTVYLDLYQRVGKFPGAAHFTLRCGRRAADGSYQTPVVALVASLSPSADLSLGEVETLFHEFGHAVHSLLSRTQFQHLAGTRGPVDTVEIPSHTMEHFARDPQVLATFARHRSTEKKLPREFVEALHTSSEMFAGLDLEQQLVFCAVDQLLHGPNPPTGVVADKAVGEIVEQYSSFAHCPGTYPHIRLNHIVGYGSTYYSYLYAQCLSANIWQQHFAADPLSRGAGEVLRHRLLERGGAREAHALVEGVLGASMMHAGDGGWFPDARSMLQQQGLVAG